LLPIHKIQMSAMLKQWIALEYSKAIASLLPLAERLYRTILDFRF
jgi:hypothetical protein